MRISDWSSDVCSSDLTPLPASVQAPGYDRSAQTAGIVHIGIGAFHRAHQAVYTDDAMAAGDRDWGIIGVSLRSGDVAAQLGPQDGLYTVSPRSAVGTRSEERRVGKECVRTCSFRLSPSHSKK